MSIRYIGSKARVAARIAELIGAPPPGSVFVDAMVGAGSVARAVAERGWPLRINDHLASSVVTAAGRLVTNVQAPFRQWGGYPAALAELNAAPASAGVIHREYSPASVAVTGRERRYFTEENAARIDGIRAEVRRWARRGAVSHTEEILLLADLLRAANAVANTAGTYGCFLRDFSPVALRPLALRPRVLLADPVPVRTSVMDVCEVAARAVRDVDVAYFDPPYTKRQYAAYYHLLETITHGDAPVVTGVTGLRPWRELASPFCYRRRALGAILALLDSCPARRILLSYSDEGHVARESLVAAVGALGVLTVHELGPVARYRANTGRGAPSHEVTELLLDLRKQPAGRHHPPAVSRIGSGR